MRTLYIAIYGPPHAGKSTLANALGRQMNLPVAECSNYLRWLRARILVRAGMLGDTFDQAAAQLTHTPATRAVLTEIGDIIRERTITGVIEGAIDLVQATDSLIVSGIRKRAELCAWLYLPHVMRLNQASQLKLIEVHRPGQREPDNYDLDGLQINQIHIENTAATPEAWAQECAALAAAWAPTWMPAKGTTA